MPEKILIVDDDKEFREELKCCLDEYDVQESCDGQEALKILSKPNEIDLVILDVQDAGIERHRGGSSSSRSGKPDISVIILTAFSSKDTAVESLRGQADEYLEKPPEMDRMKGS